MQTWLARSAVKPSGTFVHDKSLSQDGFSRTSLRERWLNVHVFPNRLPGGLLLILSQTLWMSGRMRC